MHSYIAQGDTFEDAKERAIEDLGLPEEALIIKRMDGLGERIDDRTPEEPVDEDVSVSVEVKPDYVADIARNHLMRILKHMKVRAEVRTLVDADIIRLKMHAPDGAILIGRNGKTLEALQHLVNRMSCPPGIRSPFVSLDVEDYRERRMQQLERIARRCAREALEMREEVELEPMGPADRKVIHMALRSNHAVETFSRGVEPERRVVIVAAANAR